MIDQTPPVTDDAASDYAYDVYLSYASADAEWVTHCLRPRLKNANVSVIDETDFPLGTPIIQARRAGRAAEPLYAAHCQSGVAR